ncbi:hypothetical protein CF65_02340 [Aggregatibacter actinomycetemcomitans HK1651]|nr:hypothetical protein CF65_02340 [Aggregatibacter actinomycetemcomitans HK1651]
MRCRLCLTLINFVKKLSNRSPSRILVSVRWLNFIRFLVLKSFIGKAFRERGLNGVKSPYINPQRPKIVKPKMKKKAIEIPEQTDFSPKAFKKLQRELALARAQIAYLKELEALDRQKQRQKKENH